MIDKTREVALKVLYKIDKEQAYSNNTYQQNERMGISSTTLSAGETINIIDNDGMAFYVPGGAKISFTLV